MKSVAQAWRVYLGNPPCKFHRSSCLRITSDHLTARSHLHNFTVNHCLLLKADLRRLKPQYLFLTKTLYANQNHPTHILESSNAVTAKSVSHDHLAYEHTYILTQARSHTGAMYQVAVDALVFIPIFGVTRKTTVCQVLPLSYTKI